MNFENLSRVHEAFPDKALIFTEGCIEKFNRNQLNAGWLGERYGMSMIHDFNRGTVAWTDWNILLDEKGGTNHVGNFCFAPVHADTQSGKLIYTSSYYYLGHFFKFIRPGALRVSSAASRDTLLTTAFRNPDGKLAVVVMNPSDNRQAFRLQVGDKAAESSSQPHSITTFVVE